MCRARILVLAVLSITAGRAGSAATQTAQETLDRAVADFAAGRLRDAVWRFDRLVRMVPEVAPHLWQRGIALYYVGRYEDCRDQFVAHRTVNPDDVENAAWHFLCVARHQDVTRARDTLLPVGPDARRPMREIYRMFAGTMDPSEVLVAAGSAAEARFYAHLYVGLYLHAVDDPAALDHIDAAANEEFADVGGAMHAVARLHRDHLRSVER